MIHHLAISHLNHHAEPAIGPDSDANELTEDALNLLEDVQDIARDASR